MAQTKYEKWTRTISTQRVSKVDIGFCPIVRIPIRTQQEADIYLANGVAVYQEEIQLKDGSGRIRYYIEVSVHDLAKVARR